MNDLRVQVAVTDTAWAAHLAARPELTEINFWLPSGRLRQLSVRPGEPWLFKTRKPGRLIGGGFFAGYTRLTVQNAWDTYGEANGVGSHQELLQRINDYRRGYGRPEEPDPLIGCVCLQAPTFFPYAPPIGADLFAENNPTRKGFLLDTVPGSPVEAAVQMLWGMAGVPEDWASALPVDLTWPPTRGRPRMVVPRMGQQAFRALVSGAYDQRCAVTGSRILPTF